MNVVDTEHTFEQTRELSPEDESRIGELSRQISRLSSSHDYYGAREIIEESGYEPSVFRSALVNNVALRVAQGDLNSAQIAFETFCPLSVPNKDKPLLPSGEAEINKPDFLSPEDRVEIAQIGAARGEINNNVRIREMLAQGDVFEVPLTHDELLSSKPFRDELLSTVTARMRINQRPQGMAVLRRYEAVIPIDGYRDRMTEVIRDLYRDGNIEGANETATLFKVTHDERKDLAASAITIVTEKLGKSGPGQKTLSELRTAFTTRLGLHGALLSKAEFDQAVAESGLNLLQQGHVGAFGKFVLKELPPETATTICNQAAAYHEKLQQTDIADSIRSLK